MITETDRQREYETAFNLFVAKCVRAGATEADAYIVGRNYLTADELYEEAGRVSAKIEMYGPYAHRERLMELVRRHDDKVVHAFFCVAELQGIRMLSDWMETHLASWCDYRWRWAGSGL